MKVGFIGLGQVGGQLAGSLLRNGIDLAVHDLSRDAAAPLLSKGASFAESPQALAEEVDVLITCLPTPEASAAVLEGENGALAAWRPGMIWAEMSTTDADEVLRLSEKVAAAGGLAMDCPVSGGCHRANTGNISIFAGGPREAFERMLPLLTRMGRRILHTGELGSASQLKVLTNYLATANLLTLCEALVTAKAQNLCLATSYEAIRISSGNSFVHETESQVILNGSRDIHFTLDLLAKDMRLFNEGAEQAGVNLELAPLFMKMAQDAIKRYGPREHSPNLIRRLEETCGLNVQADGFPAQIVDDEPEEEGYEVKPKVSSNAID